MDKHEELNLSFINIDSLTTSIKSDRWLPLVNMLHVDLNEKLTWLIMTVCFTIMFKT